MRGFSREVVEFMYRDGENPFVKDQGFDWSVNIPEDIGMLVMCLDTITNNSRSQRR